jgi:transposase
LHELHILPNLLPATQIARLNELLEGAGFDELVEGLCARFYHARLGRPSLQPGIYFRALLVGYFEGIDSERGIAWRVADSLALRRFLLIGLDEPTPDHFDDLADAALDRHRHAS